MARSAPSSCMISAWRSACGSSPRGSMRMAAVCSMRKILRGSAISSPAGSAGSEANQSGLYNSPEHDLRENRSPPRIESGAGRSGSCFRARLNVGRLIRRSWRPSPRRRRGSGHNPLTMMPRRARKINHMLMNNVRRLRERNSAARNLPNSRGLRLYSWHERTGCLARRNTVQEYRVQQCCVSSFHLRQPRFVSRPAWASS